MTDQELEKAAEEFAQGYEPKFRIYVEQGFEEGARRMKSRKPVGESLCGKYVETNPEIYAADCNDFGGSYSGDQIRRIRVESYKQGFYDCEMACGPGKKAESDPAEILLAALDDIYEYDSSSDSWESRRAITAISKYKKALSTETQGGGCE